MLSQSTSNSKEINCECPICSKTFTENEIETHVNRCIFLNSKSQTNENNKKQFNIFAPKPPLIKKARLSYNGQQSRSNSNVLQILDISSEEDDQQQEKLKPSTSRINTTKDKNSNKTTTNSVTSKIVQEQPLAEKMRPIIIEDFVGQDHIIAKNTVLRSVLDSNNIPSMILWGPPGCGKTTLAHIIANRCKETASSRFVKLSASSAGVSDVKEMIKIAQNELKFNRKTILFMDEIHRFNKLQQDTFLPHVENGTITLIGATTENPSFSLNSALLSRCRVIVLDKLEPVNLVQILQRALKCYDTITIDDDLMDLPDIETLDFIPKKVINRDSILWLAEMSDGDARIALNSLQLAMQSLEQIESTSEKNVKQLKNGIELISLDSIKEGIKKSHLLYDRKGDQHYDCISALHKSIRASDENAALYWSTRMMEGGEDPRYICRRLIRAASEDVGLADPQALIISLAAMQSVQLIGMPESDCIISQCVIYLARAPKSRESYRALLKCKNDIKQCKLQPSVPIHLRNAPTKLMKELGYGKGYNMLHRDESGLNYMPDGMEDRNYFSD